MAVDPAFAALLADLRSAIRPPPPGVTLARYRVALDGFLAGASELPPVERIDDFTVPVPDAGIRLRLYRPHTEAAAPLIVFLHGGGFVFGGLDTHDGLCRRLALRSGCAVAALDYRLAPEHPFPTPLNDALDALDWLNGQASALLLDPARVALCGDSAGGNIAAGMAQELARFGRPVRHLALFYPAVDPRCGSASMAALGEGHLLTREAVEWFWAHYLGQRRAEADPRFALLQSDPLGWPPTSIATAEYDPLRDEGEALGAHLRAGGTRVVARRYGGMIHGFGGLSRLTPACWVAVDDLARDLTESLRA